jgi:hypothetical protein
MTHILIEDISILIPTDNYDFETNKKDVTASIDYSRYTPEVRIPAGTKLRYQGDNAYTVEGTDTDADDNVMIIAPPKYVAKIPSGGSRKGGRR